MLCESFLDEYCRCSVLFEEWWWGSSVLCVRSRVGVQKRNDKKQTDIHLLGGKCSKNCKVFDWLLEVTS